MLVAALPARMPGIKLGILAALIIASLQFTATNFAGFAIKNLALNQLTEQNSVLNYSSNLAVSGNFDEFSLTEAWSFNWWYVRLARLDNVTVIKAFGHDGFGSPTKSVSIKTTKLAGAGIPEASNPNWIVVLSIQRLTYKLVKLYNPFYTLRCVAITTAVQRSLKINQVEIYAYSETHNVARGLSPIHSSNANPEKALAYEAVNGMFDDFASPSTGPNSYWWLDLDASYTTENIRIHNGADYSLIRNPTINLDVTCKLGVTRYWSSVGRITKDFQILEYPAKRDLDAIAIGNIETDTFLRLAEVEVFVARNLAFKKPASMSSTVGENSADKAVNGYNGDLAKADNSGLKWWRVDLLEIYSVGEVQIVYKSEQHKKTLTYFLYSAKLPQTWTLQNFSDRTTPGKFEKVIMMSPRETRYLNLTSTSDGASFLFSELIVYEYNFALEYVNVSQRMTSGNDSRFEPSNAVDNSSETFAMTNFYTDEEQWWKVELPKLTMMTSVEIFHHKSIHKHSELPSRVRKDNYYAALQIKTSTNDTPPIVSLGGNEHWKVCLNQSVSLPLPVQHLECERNLHYPLVKHLSIQPLLQKDRLVLEKVAIYGRELPEFSSNATASIIQTNYSSFSLEFKTWNVALIGAFPPTSYVAKLNNTARSRRYLHKDYKNSGKVVANFNNLEPDTAYNYNIRCHFKDIPCPGRFISGVVKTVACSAPEQPTIRWAILERNDGAALNVTVDKVDPHCVSVKEYKVELETAGEVKYSRNGRQHVIEEVMFNTYYTITATVTNTQNFSSSSSDDLVAGETVPDRPVLISSEYNSSCVRLIVTNPSTYKFSLLQFQFVCTTNSITERNTVDALNSNNIVQVFCGFPVTTVVLCTVTARNNIGDSEILHANGLTKADETVFHTDTTQSTSTTEAPAENIGVGAILFITGGLAIGAVAIFIAVMLLIPYIRNRRKVNDSPPRKEDNS